MSTLPETNNFTFENGWFLHMTCPFEAWPILRGKLAVSAFSFRECRNNFLDNKKMDQNFESSVEFARGPLTKVLKVLTSARWWFQAYFIFTPNLGEMIPVDSYSYFSNGLVQPPTSLELVNF